MHQIRSMFRRQSLVHSKQSNRMQINQMWLQSHQIHLLSMQNSAYQTQLCEISFHEIERSKSNCKRTSTIISASIMTDTFKIAIFDQRSLKNSKASTSKFENWFSSKYELQFMKFAIHKTSESIFHAERTTNESTVFMKHWILNITKNKRLNRSNSSKKITKNSFESSKKNRTKSKRKQQFKWIESTFQSKQF